MNKIMNPEYELHIKEIIDFLSTVTIKFIPFENALNLKYTGYIDIDLNNKITWPYYKNIMGEYLLTDTKIYISLNTSTGLNVNNILLNREYLENNADIKQYYINNKYLITSLYNEYPNQVDLIKNIFYPVQNTVEEVIEFNNLTLIAYDDSVLPENEKGDIIIFLKNFLSYMNNRWYIQNYENENLFSIAFWSMLWCLMPLIILTKRILNINTSFAHPYHIWEYLGSKGLGDYKGFISNKQSLFLYKNLNYILANRGKQFILDILEDVFFKSQQLTLTKKTIIHNTIDSDKAVWVPEIINGENDEFAIDNKEPLEIFLNTLYKQKKDIKFSTEYNNSIIDKFKFTKENTLLTKFFEISKPNTYSRYETQFIKYQLDTILFLYSEGKIRFNINISNINKSLSLIDITPYQSIMIMLWALANIEYIKKNNNQNIPINIKSLTITKKYKLSSTIPYTEKPTNYPIEFYSGESEEGENNKSYVPSYPSNLYMDIDSWYSDISYFSNDLYFAKDVAELINTQFTFIMNQMNLLRSSSDIRFHNLLRQQLYFLVPTNHEIDLFKDSNNDGIDDNYNIKYHSTFNEFFNDNPEISTFMLNNFNTENEYIELLYKVFNAICPLEKSISHYLDLTRYSNIFWLKIKELLTSLTSYNIAFLINDDYKIPLFDLVYLKMGLETNITHSDYMINSVIAECNNVNTKISIINNINSLYDSAFNDNKIKIEGVLSNCVQFKGIQKINIQVNLDTELNLLNGINITTEE